MLDRTVGEEAGIVAAITAAAAIVIALATDTAARLLVTYVIGSTLATLIGAYGVMAMRISGERPTEIYIYATFAWLPVILTILLAGREPAVLESLIVVLGLVAWLFRRAARRRSMRIDWCAVKPVRDRTARARAVES